MIKEPKFKLGQKVYYIYENIHNSRKVKCGVCGYTGFVEIKGKTYTCPSCNGGRLTNYSTYQVITDFVKKQFIEVFMIDGKEKTIYRYGMDTEFNDYNDEELFETEEEAKKAKKSIKKKKNHE
jgi:hypothetical protein